jgi:hypothetical protein
MNNVLSSTSPDKTPDRLELSGLEPSGLEPSGLDFSDTSSPSELSNILKSSLKTNTNTNKNKNKNKARYSILFLVFIIVVLFVYFIGLYKLLTTKKYKDLYDSETNKYIVLLNLFLSYMQIICIILFLFYYRKDVFDNINKNNMFKYGFVILAFIYIVYILSVLRFSYILKNIDDYGEKDYCFLTNYYIFMQFVPYILFFVYILKYQNKYFTIDK